MKLFKKLLLSLTALSFFILPACAVENEGGVGQLPDQEIEQAPPQEQPPQTQPPAQTPPQDQEPQISYVNYVKVVGESVNIRSGASTSYKSVGTAEKNTLYANLGVENGWIKTRYKNSIVYISSKYCQTVKMTAQEDKIEKVIAEGTKFMGVKYVYGAVRYHDGYGNKLKNFTTTAFDCSSLMQYIFKVSAGVNLQVTTRTQVKQGKTVSRSNLKRGDLMFFTNESRYYKTGVERIGHVALYLGDNLILHTASDYAKIETISAKRWSYFIQGQRVL